MKISNGSNKNRLSILEIFHKLGNYIKIVDFIGPKFSVESDDSQNFTSIQGGILTLIIILVTVGLGFMFGKEIYERKKPNVSNSVESVNESVVYLNEFPLLFFLASPTTGKIIPNYRDYFDTKIFAVTMSAEGKVTFDYKNDFEYCQANKFKKFKNLVENILNKTDPNTHICVNFDEKVHFSNAFFALNSTNINLGLKKCDKSLRKCADDLDVVLKDILVSMYYIDSTLDTTNFLKPVETFLNLITVQLSDTLLKRNYLRFQTNILISDNGWIIEDKKETLIPLLSSIVPDDIRIFESGEDKNLMYLISLEAPKFRLKTTRSFLKIQELVSQVGGLISGLMIIIDILFAHYLRFLYLFWIRNYTYELVNDTELKFKTQKCDFNKFSENNKFKVKSIDIMENGTSRYNKNYENNKKKEKSYLENISVISNNDASVYDNNIIVQEIVPMKSKLIKSVERNIVEVNKDINNLNINKNFSKEKKNDSSNFALGVNNFISDELNMNDINKNSITKNIKKIEIVPEVKFSENSKKSINIDIIESSNKSITSDDPTTKIKLRSILNDYSPTYIEYIYNLIRCHKDKSKNSSELQIQTIKQLFDIKSLVKLVIWSANPNAIKTLDL